MENKIEYDRILQEIDKWEVSDLTKEIAMAIVEVKLMQAGEIPTLTLKDID